MVCGDELREIAKLYSGDDSEEGKLMIRTLLVLARVIDSGYAKQMDCGFFLKPHLRKEANNDRPS